MIQELIRLVQYSLRANKQDDEVAIISACQRLGVSNTDFLRARLLIQISPNLIFSDLPDLDGESEL